MEPTYTVLGTDGNQYGPVTREQLRSWMTEGRVANNSQVWRSDSPDWVPASSLPELGIPNAPMTMTTAGNIGASPIPSYDPEAMRRMKSGAGWFYWIAAFTIINAITSISGGGWGFALGLGAPQLIAVLAQSGGSGQVVAMVINAMAAGLLVLFGVFAGKGQAWAFLVGMIVIALDTVLVGFVQMWISLIIHLVALFSIFNGFRASRTLR